MGFGFSFGGNSSKSSGSFTGTDNTTQNTNYTQNGTSQNNTDFTQSTTATNPEWVTGGAQSIFSGAQQLAGANPQGYVAGQNGLQAQANAGAAGLNGSGTNDVFGAARDETGYVLNSNAAQIHAATASPYISQYLNPYVTNVADATKADLDANDAQTRAAQSLALAKSGAFGGSGAAITIGQTEGQLERARATALSGIYSDGYKTALDAAQQDANRKQEAATTNANLFAGQQDRALAASQQLANLVTQQDSNTRANVEAQAAQGSALQQTQQAQAQAPLDLQSWLASQYSGLPLNLFTGQTQTGSQVENGQQTESGTQLQTGTETQNGTTTGKNSGFNFGFKLGGS